MANIKTGFISLAGLIFGLAGSYTVRRYQKDKLLFGQKPGTGDDTATNDSVNVMVTEGVTIVHDEEDI